jgi:hypothetical protein
MAKDVTLHLAKLPMDDDEALLETVIQMARNIIGKEPTAEDIAAARKTLGLPAKRPAKKRRKPTARVVKTRKQ